ncbi:MAG: type II toxin-antitoxin system VapC family toxin [Chloroflexi bacterium]|nr:type II toxin-antitoxin system VapC family toxin [Chloroflexota bacterium]
MTVVVDASLALKWVVEEEDTEPATALRAEWYEAGELLVAPPIFRPEVTNALHQKVRRGEVGRPEAVEGLQQLVSAVAIGEPAGLYERALELAAAFRLGAVYDSLYVALAELEGCEMWTADRRLVNAVQRDFPQVRWVGEAP